VVVAVDSTYWANWDPTVLSKAKYNFVEYHYYPQNPGNETDQLIVYQAAQNLAKNIETLKAELKTAGKPDTPIFVGEIGTVSSNPGKQSWSITQGLYAGQALGEMMNEGVSRLTWWIGFGNCNIDKNGNAGGNMSSSLYGWQTFGAYNVFSDGPTDGPCGVGSGPIRTMSPTARAFQLFSNVAVDGESVLPAAVAGDNTDVRAYAATHSGGTAIVLFNLNQTTQEPVKITLSGQSTSSGVKMITYSKAIYDQSKNNVWASPTTTDLGSKSLPLTVWLPPWSMNVIIIQ
jgi:alpha-L-arabinofuranosidase